MASFSDYAENKILDHAFGKAAWTMPTEVFLALCTVVPTDADTGSTLTEATYTGYARLQVKAADLNAAASGKITNSAELKFGECTAGESTVKGWALVDAATGGNVICWGTLTETVISTSQNTIPTVAADGLEGTQD